MKIINEMQYEYEVEKDYLLAYHKRMSCSEFNYRLGALNKLAGYTDNLTDYFENVLVVISEEIMGR